MQFLKNLLRGSLRTSATDYRNEGENCLTDGEYDEAIADFTAAIRLDPKNVRGYVDRGLAYEEVGQYREAISDYDVAIRLDREDSAAFLNRGNAYFALDEFHQAIADYTEALRHDPDLAIAYYYRGLAYAERGDAVRRGPTKKKPSGSIRHSPPFLGSEVIE